VERLPCQENKQENDEKEIKGKLRENKKTPKKQWSEKLQKQLENDSKYSDKPVIYDDNDVSMNKY
jgi:hypothetical protein